MAQILTKVRDPYSLILGFAKDSGLPAPLREHIDNTNDSVAPFLAEAVSSLSSRSPGLRESLHASLITKRDYDRAWFVRLGFEGCSSEHWKRASRAMTAVELSYASVVILDDIVDQGTTRFGKPCLYRTIGSDASIYVAEMLRSLANIQLLSSLDEINASAEVRFGILVRNERALCDVNFGQYLDVTCAGGDPNAFSDDDYLKLVHFTTGVDIANCLTIGAMLGGAQRELLPIFERLGSLIGIMMQARDDLLDYALSAEDIEKTPGCDFAKLRMKLPYIIAYRHGTSADRALLESAMRDLDPKRWEDVRGVVLSPSTISYVRGIMNVLRADLDTLLGTASIRPGCRKILLSFCNEIFSHE